MMVADMVYDGASLVLWHRYAGPVCAGGEKAELCESIQKITAHLGGPAVPRPTCTGGK